MLYGLSSSPNQNSNVMSGIQSARLCCNVHINTTIRTGYNILILSLNFCDQSFVLCSVQYVCRLLYNSQTGVGSLAIIISRVWKNVGLLRERKKGDDREEFSNQ